MKGQLPKSLLAFVCLLVSWQARVCGAPEKKSGEDKFSFRSIENLEGNLNNVNKQRALLFGKLQDLIAQGADVHQIRKWYLDNEKEMENLNNEIVKVAGSFPKTDHQIVSSINDFSFEVPSELKNLKDKIDLLNREEINKKASIEHLSPQAQNKELEEWDLEKRAKSEQISAIAKEVSEAAENVVPTSFEESDIPADLSPELTTFMNAQIRLFHMRNQIYKNDAVGTDARNSSLEKDIEKLNREIEIYAAKMAINSNFESQKNESDKD